LVVAEVTNPVGVVIRATSDHRHAGTLHVLRLDCGLATPQPPMGTGADNEPEFVGAALAKPQRAGADRSEAALAFGEDG